MSGWFCPDCGAWHSPDNDCLLRTKTGGLRRFEVLPRQPLQMPAFPAQPLVRHEPYFPAAFMTPGQVLLGATA